MTRARFLSLLELLLFGPYESVKVAAVIAVVCAAIDLAGRDAVPVRVALALPMYWSVITLLRAFRKWS